MGFSMPFIMMSSQAAAFSRISSEAMGQASAIFNTLQRALGSLGIALLATVLAFAHGNVRHPPLSAFHAVYLTSAILAFIGITFGLRIKDSDAAAAMARTVAAHAAGTDGDGEGLEELATAERGT
jgi:hypothetical protein